MWIMGKKSETTGNIVIMYGFYGDEGKENGNYNNGVLAMSAVLFERK